MLDSGTSCSPVNCGLSWNSDLTSTETSGRDRNENSASSSQVRRRDDNLFPSTKKSGREAQNRLTATKLIHHYFDVSDTQYIGKFFTTKVESS